MDLAPVTWEEWDRRLQQEPQALLFHTSAWLRMLGQIYRLEVLPLGCWEHGELCGLFPLLSRRIGPFRVAGSPLMQVVASTFYLGPLLPKGKLPAVLSALEAILKSEHLAHIEIAFPGLLVDADVDGAIVRGYTMEVCHSVVVRMEGCRPEQIWNGLTPACRRAVRKAQINGVTTIWADDESFIPEYYKMCREVYRTAGRLPHLTERVYTNIWRTLAPSGWVRALLAYHKGELVAGGIFLIFRGQTYYLSGASYRQELTLRPNNLIQWRFMEWAAQQGCHSYDLGGAVVPGITRFKLSMGGQLHPFARLHKARTPAARIGRAVYAQLIPEWRRICAQLLR